MSRTVVHPLVADYLDRLRTAAAELPRERRTELLEEIEAHLDEALPPDATEAEVRTTLDRLGNPIEIVREGEPDELPPPRGRRTLDVLAVLLLLLGGVVLPVLGWIVGVVLLWSSRTWSLKDQVIGTLVVPGGLLPASFFLVTTLSSTSASCVEAPFNTSPIQCSGGSGGGEHVLLTVIAIALVVLPIATTVYLLRRSRPTAR